jgi:hypothetical protein
MVTSKINSERGKMRERMDDKNLEDLWEKRNQVDIYVPMDTQVPTSIYSGSKYNGSKYI